MFTEAMDFEQSFSNRLKAHPLSHMEYDNDSVGQLVENEAEGGNK